MPISLTGMKAIIGDHEHEVAYSAFGTMTCAKSQRIVRIEVEIEVRSRIGAAKTCHTVPSCADLQIDAAAQEAKGRGLDGRLQLHVIAQADGRVGAGPSLRAKSLIGVHANPSAGVVFTPAKIDVGAEVVRVGILAHSQFPWVDGPTRLGCVADSRRANQSRSETGSQEHKL